MYLSGVKTFLDQNLVIQITFKLVMNLCLLAILLSENLRNVRGKVVGVTGLENVQASLGPFALGLYSPVFKGFWQ